LNSGRKDAVLATLKYQTPFLSIYEMILNGQTKKEITGAIAFFVLTRRCR
jgi:hypothetical protein